jgi:hypothetical protein
LFFLQHYGQPLQHHVLIQQLYLNKSPIQTKARQKKNIYPVHYVLLFFLSFEPYEQHQQHHVLIQQLCLSKIAIKKRAKQKKNIYIPIASCDNSFAFSSALCITSAAFSKKNFYIIKNFM